MNFIHFFNYENRQEFIPPNYRANYCRYYYWTITGSIFTINTIKNKHYANY